MLGLPTDCLVVANVGSLTLVKNQSLILRIASRIRETRDDVYFLLIGDGAERHSLESQAERMEIAEYIVFAGSRHDVPELLSGVVDAVIFPSISEGLGLAIIESQAAGLQCIVSDAVPSAIGICPELITRVSLSSPVEIWSEAVLAALAAMPTRQERDHALLRVRQSKYEIRECAKDLSTYYDAQISC